MKITAMQKTIALAVAFVIVAALIVVFVAMPMFTTMSGLDAQKAQAQQQVQAAQSLLNRLEEAKTRSALTEAELLKIGTQMPDSPQLPTMIVEFQDLANEAGVSVTSFVPGQPAPTGGGKFTEIPITTAVTAKWDDLLDYLRRLDASTRLVRVTNVSISPVAASTTTTDTDDEEADLAVSISMKAYVMGVNGVLTPPAVTTTGSAVPTATK
jgi:Tfp pilus assembly protein PilO